MAAQDHGLAPVLKSAERFDALLLENPSPTARASSMTRMSGSTFTATAKARRIAIPEEYGFQRMIKGGAQLGEFLNPRTA